MESLGVSVPPSTETAALIRLLSDNDEIIRTAVETRLVALGQSVIPALWQARASASGSVRERIDTLLSNLSESAGKALAFLDWRALTEGTDEVSLEEGTALVARSNYPKLSWVPYQRRLDQMADDLTIKLTGISDATETVSILAEYLFHEQAFTGPEMSDYDPDDSYMNQVIDRRRGLPISLSVLCLLIGGRMGLPLYGIGLPGHFIVALRTAETEALFDPYHKGQQVTRERCEQLLIQNHYEKTEAFFEPYTNRMMLTRMLGNLRNFYQQSQDRERLGVVTRYFNLIAGEYA